MQRETGFKGNVPSQCVAAEPTCLVKLPGGWMGDTGETRSPLSSQVNVAVAKQLTFLNQTCGFNPEENAKQRLLGF